MHGWLRPGGTLLNVQPEPGPMLLEFEDATGRRRIGRARNLATFDEDLRLTLLELDRLVEDGALARSHDGAEKFEIEFRFDAPEDWCEFVDRPRAAGLDVAPDDLARAEEALAGGEGAMIATEAQIASAFVR